MTHSKDQIARRLAKVVADQRMLLESFDLALADGSLGDHRDLDAKLERLGAERRRLTAELRFLDAHGDAAASPRSRAGGRVVREQVLDTLDEIGVPASPALISELALATSDADISASRFSSLRRDEERAARRDPAARPAWIAPALNVATLTAMPRLLTSSAWPIERRLIGARTLRTCHLRTTLALLERSLHLAATNPVRASTVEAIMMRLARGVPGAVEASQPADPERIRTAVENELQLIEQDDLKERLSATAKLRGYREQQQLWGLPAVIEGEAKLGKAVG
ncbi:hypothetical protein [Novosphingobium sp. BW1]|uniref:hypothetical protein n=1 Tax=Novosphingobium sp. BW1 TaxID=2592621 RepID=UPI0011DE82C4|nr:hypothetical protein [Novosphingobium sp. BW1]TYC78777.1 hypothetical protein FMM79_20745 [Novosphingobium sp. BW1]